MVGRDLPFYANLVDIFDTHNVLPVFYSITINKNDSAFAAGEFVAVFDPIDGSKNIDASLPVGSIFGVYRATPGTKITEKSFLQNGESLVAAGYCLYS